MEIGHGAWSNGMGQVEQPFAASVHWPAVPSACVHTLLLEMAGGPP